MILLDFNGVVVGTIVMQKLEISEDIVRHIILNSIRMYNKKFRDSHGAMVICTEGKRNWRKTYYPQYKHKRKTSREASAIDWPEVFRIINLVTEEIKENLPWYVVNVDTCEADDIIAHIALSTQEFGQHEDVMIVSADKDFLQLQEGTTNIQQFSTMTKKLLLQKDKFDIHEHICKGDSSDGVPNILSGDDTFVEGIRQAPMTKKKIEQWRDLSIMPDDTKRNYARNSKLIDLRETPDDIQAEILNAWNTKKRAHGSKVMNYLIKNRCRNLIECVSDFNNNY
jgi:5'-3' exonuclease